MEERHKTCKWAKFDELWGEYKCRLFYIRLGQRKKCEHCHNYELMKNPKSTS